MKLRASNPKNAPIETISVERNLCFDSLMSFLINLEM